VEGTRSRQLKVRYASETVERIGAMTPVLGAGSGGRNASLLECRRASGHHASSLSPIVPSEGSVQRRRRR